MNKKNLLKRMKLFLFLATISMKTTNVYASGNFEVWDNPTYGELLRNSYQSLPENLRDYLYNIGCNILVLEGNNDDLSNYCPYTYDYLGNLINIVLTNDMVMNY